MDGWMRAGPWWCSRTPSEAGSTGNDARTHANWLLFNPLLLTSDLSWLLVSNTPVIYMHACLCLICNSLVECSDICNLLKDGEDDQWKWTQQCKNTSSPAFHGVAGNGGFGRPAVLYAPDCPIRAPITCHARQSFPLFSLSLSLSKSKSKGASLATKVLYPVKNTHTFDFPWSSMRIFDQ